MNEEYDHHEEELASSSESIIPSPSSLAPRSSSTTTATRRPPITIRLPTISPRRRRDRDPKYCVMCREDHVMMSEKHRLCYDCLVQTLSTAKLFNQGFDITTKRRDKQMCIICLNTVKHIGNRYMLCIDCLIKRLGDVGILKFNESQALHPVFIALDSEYETMGYRVDWQRKKYFPCDICERDVIADKRTERLCMDCLVDNLLDTPYFRKQSRRVYF